MPQDGRKGIHKMDNQTKAAITSEELFQLMVEMTYQRAKPLLEEKERMRNKKIDAIADSVTHLVHEFEAMYGITSAPHKAGDTSIDKTESGRDDAVTSAE